MQAYKEMPTISQWKKDSSVTFAIRKSDKILARIDELVESYASYKFRRIIYLSDLYYCCEFWLRNYTKNQLMEAKRAPAMQNLFACVGRQLAVTLNCPIQNLPKELAQMFTRELTEHGFIMDFESKRATRAGTLELQLYRIWFKGGLAYQWNWWDRYSATSKKKVLDSKSVYREDAFVGGQGVLPCVNYGGFVLTTDREFYMGPHKPNNTEDYTGFFHSAYVGGKPVKAAGSMLIESGRILRIRPNSGHYKPVEANTLEVLKALQMYGVNIHGIVVENFTGQITVRAEDFVKSTRDHKIIEARELSRQNGVALHTRRREWLNTHNVTSGRTLVSNPYPDPNASDDED